MEYSGRARVDIKIYNQGFPGGANGQEPACPCRRHESCRFHSWVGKISWRSKWLPTPVGTWWAIVQRVAKILTWLKWLSKAKAWASENRPWSLGSPAGPGINSLVIGPGGVGLQDALWDRSGTPRFVGSGDGAPWALREGVICQPFHWVITPDGRTVLRGYAGENLIPFFVYIFQSSDSWFFFFKSEVWNPSKNLTKG